MNKNKGRRIQEKRHIALVSVTRCPGLLCPPCTHETGRTGSTVFQRK